MIEIPPEDQRVEFITGLVELAELVDVGYAALWVARGADKPSIHFDIHDADEIERAVRELDGYVATHDCYYGVCLRRERLDRHHRGGDADCSHQLVLGVDLDVAGPGHKGDHGFFPTLVAALDAIARLPLAPTFIIATGGGVQAGWAFDEAPDANDPLVIGLRRRLIATIRRLAGPELAAAVDSVDDAARVLRLPGTWNYKEGLARPTGLIDVDWSRRYGLTELDDALDELTPEAAPDAAMSAETKGDYRSDAWPGTAFNRQVPPGEVLAQAGFTYQRHDRAGNSYWVRPGKDARDGHSAVVYASGHATVYSTAARSTWPTLEVRRPYDSFGLFAHLFCGGRFTEAQAQLQAQGYGVADARKATLTAQADFAADDWADTMAEALMAIGAEPPPPPPPGDASSARASDASPDSPLADRPVIVVNNQGLDVITAEIVAALQVYVQRFPILFMRGAALVALVEENGVLTTVPIVRETMPQYAALAARFVRVAKGDTSGPPKLTDAFPPGAACDALAKMGLPLPQLDAISHVPVVRPDGSIHAVRGYDAATRTLYSPTSDLEGLNVPHEPTDADVRAAVELIEGALHDFPFDSESSRINAIAALLTAVLRQLIQAPTPLFGIGAKSPGSGKGLLSDLIAVVATGLPAMIINNWVGETEGRKRITALLMGGAQVVSIDNLSKPLGSDTLAALLTADVWADRVLGVSREVSIPNRVTWLANGNGLSFRGDLPRRVIHIRLDVGRPMPWRRTGFRHADLLGWARTNRRDLVRACLVIARRWFAAGQPMPAVPPMGSYQRWSTVIAGLLGVAGVTGFLADASQRDEEDDETRIEWERFLENLREHLPPGAFPARDAVRVITASGSAFGSYDAWLERVPTELINDVGQVRFVKSLGEAFGKHEGRHWNEAGLRVIRAGKDRTKTNLWEIVVDADGSPPPPAVPARGDRGDREDHLTVVGGMDVEGESRSEPPQGPLPAPASREPGSYYQPPSRVVREGKGTSTTHYETSGEEPEGNAIAKMHKGDGVELDPPRRLPARGEQARVPPDLSDPTGSDLW